MENINRFIISYRFLLLVLFVYLVACSESTIKEKQKKEAKSSFVFKEGLIKGNDTGMIKLGGFKRIRISDILCQQWELKNMEGIDSIEQVMDEKNRRIYCELIFFKDSLVLENPRSHLKMGRWNAGYQDKRLVLTLVYENDPPKEYFIQSMNAVSLVLYEKGKTGTLMKVHLEADGLMHQNEINDPFHPINNQWRIKPLKPENDKAIYQRTRQCIKFFALYFRDQIKRNHSTISFLGLPAIFHWYSGGIGLFNRDKMEDSWIQCFYNKQQSIKAYEILESLIVDYEFDWPKNAPNWVYQTHAVLEQMYAKMK